MPYEIKESKNKKFSVVNKDSSKVMSKGTTEKKAKNQIKAIYANMKPEHRLRHRIGLMRDINITDPTHKNIIRLVSDMLKKEEIHGNGFWDDAWDGVKYGLNKFKDTLALPAQIISQVPFAKYIADAIAPEFAPIFEYAPKIAKALYGTDTNQVLTDLLGDYSQDKDYKTTSQKEAEAKANQPSPVSIPVPSPVPSTNVPTKYTPTQANQFTEKLDNIVSHIQQQYDASPVYTSPVNYDADGTLIGLDAPLRFPMIYNYDENSKPMYLQDFLISNGVAGKNFSQEEFGSTVLNQAPYAFIDFPINGGNIRKLNYSKLGYSKY
tara:strand:- start:407 stop:1372 length:966 start_codon:yes stop_codon:yes gene_type:complete